ncbi:MAG TPA: DNA repair protein RecO [Salinivirgaceae bacterium]|nr:DNA repair protein RecO [Salinivirgaceae bacterium]HQA75854.1 DNA repair protein RecO [Salinivirgaceae bacterium]
MELESAKAIILQVVDYSDSQVIVHAYTSEYGRLSFITSKKSKSVKNSVLFQPLFLVEISFYGNRYSDMRRIKTVQLWKPFVDIPFNHGKTFICLFISELLSKTLREQVANKVLFNFIVSSIELFDQSCDAWNCFHLSFMAHFSKYLGIYPTFGFNASQGFDSVNIGVILDRLKNTPISDFSTIKLTRAQRQVVLNRLLSYYQMHLPIGDLFSHRVLQQF